MRHVLYRPTCNRHMANSTALNLSDDARPNRAKVQIYSDTSKVQICSDTSKNWGSATRQLAHTLNQEKSEKMERETLNP